MTDLIQEFFTRDLSEAENEALSKLLAESPDAVSRYEGLLEKNYLSLGLPQPVLPKGLQNPPYISGSAAAGGSGWMAVGLAGLALTGLAVWKFWPQAPTMTAPQASVRSEAPKPMPQNVKHAVKPPAPVKPVAVEPAQEGDALSVVVNTTQKSLVTVRILGPAGQEVRALYTGFVEPGKWSFQWDGRLDSGEAANPGNYRIDVRSGPTHLAKDIRIKP